MTDFSPRFLETPPRRSMSDSALYYTVFAVLFAAALPTLSVLRVFGHRQEGGVYRAAKRFAHGPAGYAVNV